MLYHKYVAFHYAPAARALECPSRAAWTRTQFPKCAIAPAGQTEGPPAGAPTDPPIASAPAAAHAASVPITTPLVQ